MEEVGWSPVSSRGFQTGDPVKQKQTKFILNSSTEFVDRIYCAFDLTKGKGLGLRVLSLDRASVLDKNRLEYLRDVKVSS